MLRKLKSRFDGRFLQDLVAAAGILAVTSFVSVAIGFQLNEGQLGSWGSWLGAFIAGIALVASGYALVVQARHGESTSWNIALGRLGEIYDLAYKDPRLAQFLNEKSDPEGDVRRFVENVDITPQERVWFGNLFLAYEQIFIASQALSAESRRVWGIYLKNQLNKPTIRALFVADDESAADYRADFYSFAREGPFSKPTKDPGRGVIKELFFRKDNSAECHQSLHKKLTKRPFTTSDAGFWLQLYSDSEVRKQMYAAPVSSEADLAAYLGTRTVFTVLADETPIGGFTISPEKDRLATFGIVVDVRSRGQGLGMQIMKLVEETAAEMGFLTLRGDVYADNFSSIRVLERSGFRRFLWFEKNISQDSFAQS
jgi:RimJ/RimL family protein N-acetyltransferase